MLWWSLAFLERFSARRKGSILMKCKETERLRFQMSDFNEDLMIFIKFSITSVQDCKDL